MEFRCDLVKVSCKEVCRPQRYVRSAVSAMTHCSGRLLQPATKAWTPVTFKSRENCQRAHEGSVHKVTSQRRL